MSLNRFIAALGLLAPASALLRFPCSQLTVQRLDPLVNPGQVPSAHLHQIVGGVSNKYQESESIELDSLMRYRIHSTRR